MGRFVIVSYRPKAGMEAELLAAVKKHLPVLWEEGLATERPPYVMRAQDGSIVEVFEWKSKEAVEAAHSNPAVGELWKEFEVACEYQSLATLAETNELFAEFEPVDL